MSTESQPKDLETWADRFEQAGFLGRVALLSGGGVRLTANLLDKALDRAAKTVVDAEQAFRGELDPNVSDAKIIEEIEEPRRRR